MFALFNLLPLFGFLGWAFFEVSFVLGAFVNFFEILFGTNGAFDMFSLPSEAAWSSFEKSALSNVMLGSGMYASLEGLAE